MTVKVLPVTPRELEAQIAVTAERYGMSEARLIEAVENEELEETNELLYTVMARAALGRQVASSKKVAGPPSR